MDNEETLAMVSLMKQRDIMLAALKMIATADCTGICENGYSAAYVAQQVLTHNVDFSGSTPLYGGESAGKEGSTP